MKSRHYILAILLLGLFFIAQAEEPTRFHLAIGRLSPKTGDNTEKTICFSTSFSITNFVGNHESVTNRIISVNLKFAEKILAWDATNDDAKVELAINHFSVSEQHLTNELVESGTQLVGTYLLGEWFFKSSSGNLSLKAQNLLGKLCGHPALGVEDNGYLKLDQPRMIGETWKIKFLPHLMDRLNELDNSSNSGTAKIFAKGLNINNAEMTAQFVGPTNISGINCFDLRITANMKEQEKNYRLPERWRQNISYHLTLLKCSGQKAPQLRCLALF